MKGEILIQNFINLFLVGIILETALSAIFSLSTVKDFESRKPFQAARDIITLIVAFFICYEIKSFKIFKGTGVKIPAIIDMIISALILSRMAIFIKDLISRIKRGE